MHPAKRAEDQLQHSLTTPTTESYEGFAEREIARAQVFALLAVAQAIEGLGTDIRETLRNLDVELSSIAQSIDSVSQVINSIGSE